MKALSIRQPWAWAIVHAGKRIENRSRADGRMPSLCTYRGPLLIHAAKGCTTQEFHEASLWMYSVRLAGRDLPDAPTPGRYVLAGKPTVPELSSLPRGGIVGVCNVIAHIDPMGVAWSDPRDKRPCNPPDLRWWARGYGLVLADVRPLPFMPYKGALGFFDVPGATPEDVVEVARREGRLRAEVAQ